ncbi:MAG TPA: hypothetical protein VK712_00525 [Verrucomicrobiae bacterium]|nr:hypothetical protein [Verrucomicrobiae bacterium]
MERLDEAKFASAGDLAGERDQTQSDSLARDESFPVYVRDGQRLQVIGGSYLDDGKGLCVDAINLESGELIREKPLHFYLSSEKAA